MVELPLAEGQIGVGIPAEPLRLRVTGAIEPRAAERIYLAALSGDAQALEAAIPKPSAPAEGEESAQEAATDTPEPMEWNIVDVYGDEPLALAAESGSPDVMRILLAAKASPHAANEYDGRTALHRACACGHADVVDILIEAGADAAVAMRDGSTSLHVAAASGQADVIERLLRASASDDSEAPEAEATHSLVRQTDLCGLTPLMAAAAAGNTSICALLCDHGANMEARDENGWTALFHAVDAGAAEAAAELVRRGANTRHTSNGGYTVEVLNGALVAELPPPPESDPTSPEDEKA